jgi:hypothetical protein
VLFLLRCQLFSRPQKVLNQIDVELLGVARALALQSIAAYARAAYLVDAPAELTVVDSTKGHQPDIAKAGAVAPAYP